MYSRRTAFLLPILIAVLWVLAGFTRPGVGMRGTDIGLSSDINRGGSAKVDTFSVLIRDANLPNTAAQDSGFVLADGGYDSIIGDTDGTYLRWGCTSTATPDAPYNNSGLGGYTDKAVEDDRPDPIRTTFIWADISSLPNNIEILDARICFSIQKYSTVDFTNGYVAARADTHYADYAMIDSASTVTPADPNFLATTFNAVDGTNAWTLGLGSRDDWHDFGPRGTVNDSLGSQAQDTAVQVDFAGPLQQIVDAGTQNRGIILVPYVVGTNASNLRIAMGPDLGGYAPTGNPCLTITYATRRGDRPWGGVEMPVVVTLDDADTSHVHFGNALSAAGHSHSEMFCGSTMAGGASRMSQAQIDAINDNPSIDVVMHGRTHSGLGNAADQDQIDYWLYRDWTATELTTPRDTTAGYYKDFAYPADGTFSGTYSLPALSRLVEAGYRSARAAGDNGWTGIGRENNLAWDGYANIYMIGASSPTRLFGTSTPFTDSKISDEFGDMVDEYYTDRLKSPLIFYWHDVLTGGSYANSGVNYDQFDYFISVVDSASACDFRTFGNVVQARLAGQAFISPADVTVANGATTQNETSAAIHDSVWTADGDANFLGMWLAPWERGYQYSSAIDTEAPLPPSGLQAFAGDDQVVLSWSAPAEKAIVRYNVYRYFDGGVDTTLVISGLGAAYYQDTSVVNGAHYNYFVSASDLAGNESYDTDHVSAVPVGALSMAAPSYFAFHYDQNPSASPASSAQLDSLAAFDAVVLGAASMLGNTEKPFYTNIRDELIARNSDMAILNYIIAITPKTVWASYPAGSAPRRSWDFLAGISDSLGFGKNLSGIVVRSDRYPTFFTNVMTAAYADTLARYWVDDFEGSEVDGPFAGFFVDLVDSTLGTHLCNANACIDVMDYDQDGTEYSADADEKAAFKEFQMTFIRGLRREMGERGMGDRLVVINGPLVLGDAEAASYADGYLVESWNKLKPGPQGTEAAWDDAIAAADNLVNSQTNPPLVLWSSEIDSSMAFIGEPVALASGGLVHVADAGDRLGENAIPAMVRRLPSPGTVTSYSAANDTLVVNATQYTAYLDINHTAADTFGVWPYLVIAANGDTISRGGGWPRADDGILDAPTFSSITTSYPTYADTTSGNIVWPTRTVVADVDVWAKPSFYTVDVADDTSNVTRLTPAATDWSDSYDTGIAYPVWAADSGGIDLTWTDAANEDYYWLEMQASGGSWVTVDSTIAQNATSFTHDVSNANGAEPNRGEINYRLTAVKTTGGYQRSSATLANSLFYNQAARIYHKFYIGRPEEVGLTAVSATLDTLITAQEATGPDVAAPDTTGVFVAAMFDTTMAGASDVMVGVHVDAAQSDEQLLARLQWKNAYNGTWAPADSTGEWHPATVATDSFMMWQQTGSSTSAIEGDTLYVRVALRDDESTPNISQWIDTTSPIAKVFARAAVDTAAPDTAGVFAAALFDTTTGGSSNVMVGMHLDAAQSDEPLFARMQWKNAYNGTWAPSDSSGQWHPASVASDSFIVWQQTSATTASLDGDTLYVRARLRDDESTPNISPWIDLGDPIAKVFVQAAGSSESTAGYTDTAYDDSRPIAYPASNQMYLYRIQMPEAGSVTKGSAYITTTCTSYDLKAVLYSFSTVNQTGSSSGDVVAEGEVTSASTTGDYVDVTFTTPYSASSSEVLYLAIKAGNTSGGDGNVYVHFDSDGGASGTTVITLYDDAPAYASFPFDPISTSSTYCGTGCDTTPGRMFGFYITYTP